MFNRGPIRNPSRVSRRALAIAGVAAVATTVSSPARAAADSNYVTAGNCAAFESSPAADPGVVCAEEKIPAGWKLALDSAGRANRFRVMASRDATIDGRRRPLVFTEMGATLDRTELPAPERSRTTSSFAGIEPRHTDIPAGGTTASPTPAAAAARPRATASPPEPVAASPPPPQPPATGRSPASDPHGAVDRVRALREPERKYRRVCGGRRGCTRRDREVRRHQHRHR